MKKLLLCAAAAAAFSTHAAAQEFPAKPVRIVVPNPPGGTVDIVARAVAQPMSVALGQNVLVDVRPGGSGIIGTEIVARAPADGHTLLMVAANFATNPLFRTLPYDTLKGFVPVARVASTPLLFAVYPSTPANTLADLVGMAKAKPGALNLASSPTGSSIHLIAAMFQARAGIEMNHVPYQGGVQAALAVAGGHAGVMFAPLSDAVPHLLSGKLRPLAVTSVERADLVKEVPTIAESGYPGFEGLSWFGAVVPAGTPAKIVERLSAEMLRAAGSPEARALFARLGLSPAPMKAAEFDAFIRSEMRNYGEIVRKNNIKADL